MSRHSEYRKRLRDQVLEAYGPYCSCCNESHRSMCQIDHVNGGGNKERRAGIKSAKLCKMLIEKGFPKEYRILCANCNQSREIKGGRCPHEDEEADYIRLRINYWRRRLYKLEQQNKELPKDVL